MAKRIAEERAKALTGHGTLYRALDRIETAGWATSEWEDPAVAAAEGRPRRRLYTITAAGRDVLALYVAEQTARGAVEGWALP